MGVITHLAVSVYLQLLGPAHTAFSKRWNKVFLGPC